MEVVVEKAATLAAQNAKRIAAAAGVVAAGGVGAIVDHAIVKKKDEKIIKEEKVRAYKHGYQDAAQEGETIIQQSFIYPILARIALSYYIARADGTISKDEKELLDEKVNFVVGNPDLPSIIHKEIKAIRDNREIDFEYVREYLDRVSSEQLCSLSDELNDIATKDDGISPEEQRVIEEYEQYLIQRTDRPVTDSNYGFEGVFIPEEKINEAVAEYSLKMRMLDDAFSLKTKLDRQEISILTAATAMQCARIFLINHLTAIEKAGKGKREAALHQKQGKILNHIDKGYDEKARKYYAPLHQIATTTGVPYDTTLVDGNKYPIFAGEKKGEGVNHRFSTLGHDPIIGLVVGTANIMTNTVTTVHENAPIPRTFHVEYDALFGHPTILDNSPASLVTALNRITVRTQDDITPLAAALLKQLIHIASDLYTPAGIQLPGANLTLSRKNAELLTRYISFGDAVKIGTSMGIDILINKLVELLHAAMLLERGENLEQDIHQVKTRKIVLYSNAIATGSNVLTQTITANYEKLDWAGLVVLLKRAFDDIDFIYDVKWEFIRKGLGEV